MKIERVMRHEVSTTQVYEMSILEAFQERKCIEAGALTWSIRITGAGDDVVVSTRRKLPTVGFPSLIRKIVPAGVTSTETITWAAPASDGARTARLHVDFHGAPAQMTGTIALRPLPGGGAEILVDADFTARIPLVGKQVEKLAAPIILGIIDAEEQTGRAWLAESA